MHCESCDLKPIDWGVPVLETNIDLYSNECWIADGIVLLNENENPLHKMLDCVTKWAENGVSVLWPTTGRNENVDSSAHLSLQ